MCIELMYNVLNFQARPANTIVTSNDLRRGGLLPAVIYQKSRSVSLPLLISHKEFFKLYMEGSVESKLFRLKRSDTLGFQEVLKNKLDYIEKQTKKGHVFDDVADKIAAAKKGIDWNSLYKNDLVSSNSAAPSKKQKKENDQKEEDIFVLVKDVQFDPVTDSPIHLDLWKVHLNDVVRVNVALRVLNREVAVGIKRGGVLSFMRRTLLLECKASSIPASIDVDIANMKLGDIIHANQLSLPDGTKYVEQQDHPVLSISGRGLKSDSAAEGSEEKGDASNKK